MARRDASEGEDDGDWDDLFDGVDEASDAGALSRGLAFGFLAMTPLFLLYELGAADGSRRSAAELVMTYPLRPLGVDLASVRQVLLVVLATLSLVWCAKRHFALGPRLLRVPLEGLLGALFIGPATALLMQVFDAAPLAAPGQSAGGVPGQARAAFVAGAAAWEEVLFRVGLFSLLWMLTRRVIVWCGGSGRASVIGAELVAPIGSALLFAAFHLDAVLRFLGPGGEVFDLAVFSWRALAGLLLAILFRLRGPGVAAWSHAFFNVSLLLGAGPQVFL
ncbi:MAG: CPBP family glutamic-type intramembrane protease [Planctomycetota bacterium]